MSRIAAATGAASLLPRRRSNHVAKEVGLHSGGAVAREVSRRGRPSAVHAFVFSSAVEESETPENISNTAWWESVYVHEVMTPNPVAVTPETSIFAALELISKRRISGIAVVESGEVVGVVSSYDILASDVTPGQLDKSDGFFPPIGRCDEGFNGDKKAMWRSFFSLKNGIIKAQASKVADSMHETYTVSVNDSLSNAADILVRRNTHRAFVLDDEGRLCGVITRGDILRKTMEKYRQADVGSF